MYFSYETRMVSCRLVQSINAHKYLGVEVQCFGTAVQRTREKTNRLITVWTTSLVLAVYSDWLVSKGVTCQLTSKHKGSTICSLRYISMETVLEIV